MLEPDVKGPEANHWELDFTSSCRQRLGHNQLYLKMNSGGLQSGGKETSYKTISAAQVKFELRKWLWDRKETFGG